MKLYVYFHFLNSAAKNCQEKEQKEEEKRVKKWTCSLDWKLTQGRFSLLDGYDLFILFRLEVI